MLAFTRRRGVRYRRDGRVETVRALDQFRDQLSRDHEYFSSRVAQIDDDDDQSWREEEEEEEKGGDVDVHIDSSDYAR